MTIWTRPALAALSLFAAVAALAAGAAVSSFYDLKTDNLQGWDYDGLDPLAAVLAKHAAEVP